MGHYTDMVLGVRLSSTTPDDVVDILEWMCIDTGTRLDWGINPPPYPDLPFFQYWGDSRDWVEREKTWGHPASILHPPVDSIANGQTAPSFERNFWPPETEEGKPGHRLSVYTRKKGDWDEFLEFIKPYCCTPDPPEFVGYLLSDHNSVPTLLFCNGRGGIDRMVPPQ